MNLGKHMSSNSLWAGVRSVVSALIGDGTRQGWYLRNSSISVLWELLNGGNPLGGSGKGKSSRAS